MLYISRNRKGQFFSYDALVATIAFLLVFSVLTVYWFNLRSLMSSPHELLVDDALRIADQLVTPGTPIDWQNSPANVQQFGLTTDWDSNVIDDSKVSALASLANPASVDSYNSVKDRLRTLYDFYITIEDNNGNVLNSIGKVPPTQASQQINVERIVIYRNSTAKLRVQLWSNEV